MNYGSKEVCRDCANAKNHTGQSCYCTKYGIIIGYSKTECRGYEREQVREREDRD